MANSAQVQAQSRSAEQREFERFDIDLPGHIFIPAEETTIECQVINLSGGGAGIYCQEPPPLHTYIVLYIDGFGRFEGVASRFVEGELGIRFVCKENKRRRLLTDLMSFVSSGAKGVTRLRRHPRVSALNSGYLLRANGTKERCEIIDISLQGVSLKTNVRPPVGEFINLGKCYGRVIRHHEDGIAIQFLEAIASASPDPHVG